MGGLKRYMLILALGGFLSACTGTPEPHVPVSSLTPLPAGIVDPADDVLKGAVTAFLRETGAPVSSLYKYRRFDLNNDGRRDALVVFQNPYGYWCGIYGCTMLVMRAENEDFKLVNAVQTVREPVFAGRQTTNGWKDIIIHVSGRWQKTKDVALQFNGMSYPAHPSELPEYLRLASNDDVPLFKE